MGIRVWLRGTLPSPDRVFNLNPASGFGDKVKVEVYATERYFTVSGKPYCEDETADIESVNTAGLYKLLHEIRAQHPAPRNERAESADAGEGTKATWHGTFTCSKFDIFRNGTVVSDKPFVIDNGIGRLQYDSHSEADLGFCTVLAIMHDGDADKIWDEYEGSPLARPKWLNRKDDFIRLTVGKAIASAARAKEKQNPAVEPPNAGQQNTAQAQANAAAEASKDATGTFPHADADVQDEVTVAIIPPFDDSMLVGASRKLVDAICEGTTIPRQYGMHVAKSMMSSIMTTYKIALEGCDSPRSYFIVFGDSGTGKGEAFRRLMTILDSVTEKVKPFVYITDTLDSEAGMRDAFFDIPEEKNAPLLYFVDEVLTLGQKADGKKNPEIIGGIVEMANKTTVSRAKAKRGKEQSFKTRKDAWLLLYACAQDAEAFATAFPRKKKQGFSDRFIPEYSGKVEAGNLSTPNSTLGLEALFEMVKVAKQMKGITMAPGIREMVEAVWATQPQEVKTSPRLRQQLLLEMYFAAFSRGSLVAEQSDWLVALKWFERQKAIRRVFFSEEIPDMVGVYTQRLRKAIQEMLWALREGRHLGEVAMSMRDLATKVGAYKDNDLSTFQRAWQSMLTFFVEIDVKGSNGHTYQKVVPVPAETDTWLPLDFKIIHPKK
jgi:hypothetical protein